MYTRNRLPLLLTAALIFQTGCSNRKPPATPTALPAIAAPSQLSPARREVIRLLNQEWQFFGQQIVQLDGEKESIPQVGKWEDDGAPWSSRINDYWRTVGKPGLDGMDCQEPWSAAFISWVMENAGVPADQFPPSEAHWTYVRHIILNASSPDEAFIAHPIAGYTPKPGDLICATRGNHGFIPVYQMSPATVLQDHVRLHCDIVVELAGNQLIAIGGNVRNSVSKTRITLDAKGRLKPSERRPWFVVLENRL